MIKRKGSFENVENYIFDATKVRFKVESRFANFPSNGNLRHCMLAKRIWLQHFWFFGKHCNESQNESQSRLRSNLESPCNLRS